MTVQLQKKKYIHTYRVYYNIALPGSHFDSDCKCQTHFITPVSQIPCKTQLKKQTAQLYAIL